MILRPHPGGAGAGEKSPDRLYIGNRSAGLTRAYIQFATMPTIPEGSTITSATMTLHLTSGTSTAANASAYMVTGGEWTSGTIQWSNMPAANVLLQGDISHNNVTGYTFSCLTAVQAWYNGDPTGQHNNYGIMLKYANESIDDYNAVYSADYTDADKRPKLTISYTISQVSVVEGYIKKLPFSETTETITWASSDTGIAIATTGGNVIGVKAGSAIVTGTVNGVVMYTYTVHVVIADGVYYIKSESAGLYLGTYGSIAENTSVKLFAQATSGLAQVRQLWKITYLGSGYYSIRPMHKLDMTLHVTTNSVDIATAGTVDSLNGVALANRWGIEKGSDGYYLNYVNTGSISMKPVDGAVSPGMSVVTASNSGTSSFEWELVKVEDPPCGVLLYDTETKNIVTNPTRYVTVGESKTLEGLNLFPVIYSEDTNDIQNTDWTFGTDSSNITVDSATGEVTGESVGTALITGTCAFGSIEINVLVVPIPEGTYYIRSWHSDKYIDIKDQVMASGTTIHQWQFHAGNSQRWVFTHISDNVYSIHSANSSTKYYLGVNGDSGDNNQAVVLKTGELTNGMKWKITVTSSGAYKITPLSGEANDRVLSVFLAPPNNAYVDGNEICQSDYTQDTVYADEWLLCPVTDACKLEGQQTDVWCWVASDRMASYLYMDSQVSQASAAVYVKNNIRTLNPTETQIANATSTGTPAEAEIALEYIIGGQNVYHTSWEIYDEATLRSILDNSVPVIINRGWYLNGERDDGHATVICGYIWDNESQVYVYKILDPSPVNYGITYYRSYASICNGQNVVSSYDSKDRGIWESVVVYTVGDYENTISWPGV